MPVDTTVIMQHLYIYPPAAVSLWPSDVTPHKPAIMPHGVCEGFPNTLLLMCTCTTTSRAFAFLCHQHS